MEPILELATRITSHLWLFHELHPNEADVRKVLAMNRRDILEEPAARDYSRLQALLDLTGQTAETDWYPNDPLRRISLDEQKAEQFQWRDPFQLRRTQLASLQPNSIRWHLRPPHADGNRGTAGNKHD